MMDGAMRAPRADAVLMQPVEDPAGWRPEEITATEDWAYRFTDSAIAEIIDASRAAEASGKPLVDLRREDFPLPKTAPDLSDIYEEIKNGRGFVQLRGLPVADMSRSLAATVFWGIGTYMGTALSQNGAGNMLGHVKDLGKDYWAPKVRAYETKYAMAFHNDACDMVALICLNPAKSGGASRVCSSVTIYNEMLKRRPELVADLSKDLFWSLHGETSPGGDPWYKMPIFEVTNGVLRVRGASTHARKAQDLPGAERWSKTRNEAVDMFQALAQEFAADLPFQQGDLQILNSHVTVHSRRDYEDGDETSNIRHLLRLWLRNDDLRPVTDLVRKNYNGIELDGFVPNAPLETADADAID